MDINRTVVQPLVDLFQALVSTFQRLITGQLSAQDIFTAIRTSPIFTHPPYLLAFLLCTLPPLLFWVDRLGSQPPSPEVQKKYAQKKTQ